MGVYHLENCMEFSIRIGYGPGPLRTGHGKRPAMKLKPGVYVNYSWLSFWPNSILTQPHIGMYCFWSFWHVSFNPIPIYEFVRFPQRWSGRPWHLFVPIHLERKKRWVISLFNYSFLARQYRNLSWYKWGCRCFGIVTLGCNRTILQVQCRSVNDIKNAKWWLSHLGLFLCVDSPQRSVTIPITVTGWPSVHGDSLRHGSIHGLLWSFKPWKNQHEKEDLGSKFGGCSKAKQMFSKGNGTHIFSII